MQRIINWVVLKYSPYKIKNKVTRSIIIITCIPFSRCCNNEAPYCSAVLSGTHSRTLISNILCFGSGASSWKPKIEKQNQILTFGDRNFVLIKGVHRFVNNLYNFVLTLHLPLFLFKVRNLYINRTVCTIRSKNICI